MSLKGKRVFVSGGAGVIGRPLVQQLISRGALVYVGDLKARPEEFSEAVMYRQGDLNTLESEEIADFKPEYFFHLAATFERSKESYPFWDENYKHNLGLSHHLMTLLKDFSCLKKVIFASSYLIYDPVLYMHDSPAGKPYSLRETDSIAPRNLTGVAKFNHETELKFLEEFLGERSQFLSARIYRVYGKGSRDIISRWVRALLRGETITVYQDENIFDYIYADEVAKGLVLLAENHNAKGIINLGTGKAEKVQVVIDVLRENFPEMKLRKEKAEGQFEASQADMALYQGLLGETPNNDLRQSIKEIIDYEKSLDPASLSGPGHVLVTSVSKKIPLLKAVKAAAAKLSPDIEVWGADIDSSCMGTYFVDHFWHMPMLSDLEPKEFVDFCKSNNINAVIPTRDGELRYFAKHKEFFRMQGIQTMVSSEDTVIRCVDKYAFYKYAEAEGFPVISSFKNLEGVMTNRVVVKECTGSASQNIALDLTLEQAADYADFLEEPLFQPYVEGREFSADLYVSQNQDVKGVVLRWRDQVVDGESRVSTTFSNPAFEKEIAQLANFLGIRGHAVLQAIVDKDNNVHVIEVNPRFGGASTLSLGVGLDSFYWFLLESSGSDISKIPFIRRQDKKLIRYPQDAIILN